MVTYNVQVAVDAKRKVFIRIEVSIRGRTPRTYSGLVQRGAD
jgi:hypothetical protein